jgi:hypothetical protein
MPPIADTTRKGASMAESIRLTRDQLQALATIAGEDGTVIVHQLSDEPGDVGDIYATVVGADHGQRITPSGGATDMGHTLSADAGP